LGAQPRRAAPPARGGRRVLWVDDAIRTYYHAVSHLVFAGYEVSTARGYYEAKQKLKSRAFDYLILDFDLGEGTTGFDIVRDLVLAGHRTRMMFVTAYLEEATRRCPASLEHVPIFDKNQILSGATSGRDDSALIRALDALSPLTVESSRASLKCELKAATTALRPSWLGRLIPRWRVFAKGRREATTFTAALPILAIATTVMTQIGTWVPPVLQEHALLHFLTGVVLAPALLIYAYSCPPPMKEFASAEVLYRSLSEQTAGEILIDEAREAVTAGGASPSPSNYLLAQQYWLLLDHSKWPQRLVISLLALVASGIMVAMYAELFIETTIKAAEAFLHWVEVKFLIVRA
jgi:CheY-like chemotaxis protein